MRTFLLLWLAGLCPLVGWGQAVPFAVDFAQPGKPFPHYWNSTGFSPADLLDYPDMAMTLNYLRAAHGGAVRFNRPHYLLDHVTVTGFATPRQAYDWSALDRKLDLLVANQQTLIFELMGTPQGVEGIDFADDTHLHAWKRLVRDLARHYAGRYGAETLRSWWFETSNEPDLWHFWPHGLVKFLHYYDACSEGLLEADPALRFGGPGTARGASDTFKLLMEHCAYGRNYFTGEKGVRIDFISTHRKNTPYEMIADELKVWRYVAHDFPQFRDLPIVNDESDPIAGWGIPYFWRTGPWYAAFVPQMVDLHNRFILDSLPMPYGILSNDNGFLGSWGKRTHLARFLPGDNDASTRGASRQGGARVVTVAADDRPPVTEFFLIKKPVFTVMSLLELLGETRFAVAGPADSLRPAVGTIATRTQGGAYALCVYHRPELDLRSYGFQETMTPPPADARTIGQAATATLDLRGLADGRYRLVQYQLDEKNGNPYATWVDQGAPEDLTLAQYQALAAAMEPPVVRHETVEVRDGSFSQEVALPSSGLSVLVLAPENATPPAQVTGLEIQPYQGLGGLPQRMLLWDQPQAEGILTYEVEYRAPGSRRFTRINPTHLLDHGFVHVLPTDERGGAYRVRMVDYQGRAGAYSPELSVE